MKSEVCRLNVCGLLNFKLTILVLDMSTSTDTILLSLVSASDLLSIKNASLSKTIDDDFMSFERGSPVLLYTYKPVSTLRPQYLLTPEDIKNYAT